MSREFPYINWSDGMKIQKDHFLHSDNAHKQWLQSNIAAFVSPVRYGLLPQISSDRQNFNVKISVDNQNTVKVSLISLEALTLGGIRISIQNGNSMPQTGVSAFECSFNRPDTQANWWIVLLANPYQPIPYGEPLADEMPPRQPFLDTRYEVKLATSDYDQYSTNPSALIIGKLIASPNEVKVDNDFIPPCIASSAHADLLGFCGEIENFLSNLEQKSVLIVQKILTKNQQNDLSELVQFVCDRLLLFLGQTVNSIRWQVPHESPLAMFLTMSSLSRVMKNAIDLRLGSGKEEMMNYLIEWSELKQGELDALLTEMALLNYNHNDVNAAIPKVIRFASVISRLFETLSKLEFIGKKKETGYFVNEAPTAPQEAPNSEKPKRRFFG
ncbi:MAG: hypothetical protein JSS78_03075 [Bacteroidetes bacterium]|nr:hypothetical protein [Bacteroidota bacterium]